MVNLIAWMLLLSAMTSMAQAGGCHAVNVSAGFAFTCAVLQDGSARCWGVADNGRLGRPTITTASAPIGPPLDFGTGRTVVQLATYQESSCAILDNHTMSCWGYNEAGQLGLGDTQDRPQPTQVQVGTGNQVILKISTGSYAGHSCAVVKGEGVFCWGSAEEPLGIPWLGEPNRTFFDGNSADGTLSFLPSKVDLGSDSGSLVVLDMCAGIEHTCVLSVQLGLKCFGELTSGQLGLGNITNTTGLTGSSLPSVNLGTNSLAVQISCGDSHTCAVLDNGSLKCFGDNTYGQLGYGDTVIRGANTDMGDRLKPVDVGKGRTVKQVAAGPGHTCVLLDNGQVKCWGDNQSGELGHHCSNDTWGDKPGQMGDSLPAVDLGPGRTAASVSTGYAHSCAALDDGSVKCWGFNSHSELGYNSSSDTVCPPRQTVNLCTSGTVAGNSTGPGSSSNSSPLTPSPSTTAPPTTPSPPTHTPSPADCRVANVSGGAFFTCAVLHDGSGRCWGSDASGDLGRPENTTPSGPNGPPLDVGAERSVTQLATYRESACALLDDHTMSCWGYNLEGSLGLGDTQNHEQPTQVQLGTGNQTVQLLSTGSATRHSCAVVKGEGVFCWGPADELQGAPWLGEPNSTFEGYVGSQALYVVLPSKVDLGSGSGSRLTVIDMCAGTAHTCVLTVQLGLKCWGVTTDGQLGLGNITNTTGLTGHSLPSVNLGAGRSAVQITCGPYHTCAVLDNGALKCFGDNTYGQLGYGDAVSRGATNADMGVALKPVDVGKGHTVKQVSAGEDHTCALLDNGQVKCWGWNAWGQLGHHCSSDTWGDSPGQMGDSLPAVDLGPGRTAMSISAGDIHSCAVLDDSSIKCWGSNQGGELGFNSSSDRVCLPSQKVDLCTSSTVQGNSTGPDNSSSPMPLAPSPTAHTPLKPTAAAPSPAALRTSPAAPPAPAPRAPSPTPAGLASSDATSSAPGLLVAAPSPSSRSKFSKGGVAGITLGCVIGVAAVVALTVVMYRRYKGTPASSTSALQSAGGGFEAAAIPTEAVKIAGLPQGEPFVLVTAENYTWTEAAALVGPVYAIEAGVNDIQLDKLLQERVRTPQVAAPLYCPAVQLSKDELCQQVQLLSDGLLGRGATALVFKCVWPCRFGPNALLAAKVLHTESELDMTVLSSFAYEANLLAEMQHPHVVKLYGYCLDPPTVCLILELLPCSLKDVLYNAPSEAASSQAMGNTALNSQHMPRQGVRGPTPSANQTRSSSTVNEPSNALSMPLEVATDDTRSDGTVEDKFTDSVALKSSVHPLKPVMLPQIVRMCTDIAAGLAYLHSRPAPAATVDGRDQHVPIPTTRDGRIVHRDMKPANILLNSQGVAKISDFGLARQHDHTTFATINLGAGTLPYMAPELLISSKAGVSGAACTNRVDVYSLGIIMWELLMGQRPWQGMSTAAIAAAVMNRRRLPLPDGGQAQSQDAEHAIMDMPLPQTLPAHAHPDLPKMCHIIQACWQHRELRRPTAAALHGTLSALLHQLKHTTSLSS